MHLVAQQRDSEGQYLLVNLVEKRPRIFGRRCSRRRVKLADTINVRLRKTPMPRNIIAVSNLLAVPLKIIQNVPSITEEKHDVVVMCSMLQSKGMPYFVQACEIDYCISEEWIFSS